MIFEVYLNNDMSLSNLNAQLAKIVKLTLKYLESMTQKDTM